MLTKVLVWWYYRKLFNKVTKSPIFPGATLRTTRVLAQARFDELIGEVSTFAKLPGEWSWRVYSRTAVLAARLKSDFGLGPIADENAQIRIRNNFGYGDIATRLSEEVVAAIAYLFDETGVSWPVFRQDVLKQMKVCGRTDYFRATVPVLPNCATP